MIQSKCLFCNKELSCESKTYGTKLWTAYKCEECLTFDGFSRFEILFINQKLYEISFATVDYTFVCNIYGEKTTTISEYNGSSMELDLVDWNYNSIEKIEEQLDFIMSFS